jgi:hypothetical protein
VCPNTGAQNNSALNRLTPLITGIMRTARCPITRGQSSFRSCGFQPRLGCLISASEVGRLNLERVLPESLIDTAELPGFCSVGRATEHLVMVHIGPYHLAVDSAMLPAPSAKPVRSVNQPMP